MLHRASHVVVDLLHIDTRVVHIVIHNLSKNAGLIKQLVTDHSETLVSYLSVPARVA